jgi:heme/copper-type cytochrome/quinol oxidase subunit 2
MKTRTWIILASSISVSFALGVFYVAHEVWVARAQIDAWSNTKYQTTTPAADLPIEIVGQKFEWRIRYPSSQRLQNDSQLAENFAKEANTDQEQADDVHLVNELHVWKNAKVHIHLKSADVPHSFFVPRLHLKQDVEPGKVALIWLEADKSNATRDPEAADWTHGDAWEFMCAEYGEGHRKMRGELFVHETKDDFLKWLKQAEEVK